VSPSALKKVPVNPGAVFALLKELKTEAGKDKPIAVCGARGLVPVLAKELARGGVESAVREHGSLDQAAALVQIVAGELGDEDGARLREAARKRIPVAVVAIGVKGHVPYVLDEHVIHIGSGAGFPVDQVAAKLARSLGERGTSLAARLPVLRKPVCDVLIRKFSRQNALVGVVVFIPGADLPVMTLNQVRMVLRIADAHGFEIDRERLPEVLAIIASGFGFRALSRKAVGYVPVVGWAIKGIVGFTATRALGEAAVRYFERRAPVTKVAGERMRFPS